MKLYQKISLGLLISISGFGAYAQSYCPQNVKIICRGDDLSRCYSQIPGWRLSGTMSPSGKIHSGSYFFVEAGDTSPLAGADGYVWCMYRSDNTYVSLDQNIRTLTADLKSPGNWRLSESEGMEYHCGDYHSDTPIATTQCPLTNKK